MNGDENRNASARSGAGDRDADDHPGETAMDRLSRAGSGITDGDLADDSGSGEKAADGQLNVGRSEMGGGSGAKMQGAGSPSGGGGPSASELGGLEVETNDIATDAGVRGGAGESEESAAGSSGA